LDREAAGVLSASSGWAGAEWNGRFLAYDGPYESLKEIGDRNFETAMQGGEASFLLRDRDASGGKELAHQVPTADC
jgi:hypothetical protein